MLLKRNEGNVRKLVYIAVILIAAMLLVPTNLSNNSFGVQGTNDLIKGVHNTEIKLFENLSFLGNEIEWEREFEDGHTPYGIASDSKGNIIIAGYSDNLKLLTIKYDKNGTLLWRKNENAPGLFTTSTVTDVSVSVDSEDNIVIVGDYIIFIELNQLLLSFIDIFVIKYDSNGERIWQRSYGRIWRPLEGAWAVDIDSDGNIFVVGFRGSIITRAAQGWVMKLDRNGHKIWEEFDDPARTAGDVIHYEDVAINSNGDVVITCKLRGKIDGDSDYDIGIVTYNGSTGKKIVQWEYDIGPNWAELSYEISIDSSDNIIVAGCYGISNGTIWNCRFHIVKFDPNSSIIWEKREENILGKIKGLAIGHNDEIVVTGFNMKLVENIWKYYYCTIIYEAESADVIWMSVDGIGVEKVSSGVTLDPSGHIIITGARCYDSYHNCNWYTIKYAKTV